MLILIVEDEISILQTLSLKLRKEGYEVETSSTALEALELLKQTTPDLVITDILMPYMSGLEFISIIKQQEHLKHIPIFVLSTLGQEDAVEQAFILGADDYLKKPVSLAELVVRLKRIRRIKQG